MKKQHRKNSDDIIIVMSQQEVSFFLFFHCSFSPILKCVSSSSSSKIMDVFGQVQHTKSNEKSSVYYGTSPKRRDSEKWPALMSTACETIQPQNEVFRASLRSVYVKKVFLSAFMTFFYVEIPSWLRSHAERMRPRKRQEKGNQTANEQEL